MEVYHKQRGQERWTRRIGAQKQASKMYRCSQSKAVCAHFYHSCVNQSPNPDGLAQEEGREHNRVPRSPRDGHTVPGLALPVWIEPFAAMGI